MQSQASYVMFRRKYSVGKAVCEMCIQTDSSNFIPSTMHGDTFDRRIIDT